MRLSASPTLIVGDRSPIEIDIVTTDETKIEYIDARIRGDQGWSVGSGKSRVTQRVHFPELTTRLMGEGVLPPSTTTRFSTLSKRGLRKRVVGKWWKARMTSC